MRHGERGGEHDGGDDGDGDAMRMRATTLTYTIERRRGRGAVQRSMRATGRLSFIAAPNFESADAGPNNVYDVMVQVSDGDADATRRAITVTVTNANEAPVITSNGGGETAR